MTKERYEFLKDYKRSCMNSNTETLREGRKYWAAKYNEAIADGDDAGRADAVDRLALIISAQLERGLE